MGERSFARTVWYRIPEVGATQWLTVEASGRTLALVDLAAFVQPQTIAAPAARPPNLREPNVCDGVGARRVGRDDRADLGRSRCLIPPAAPSCVQVGRRGTVGSLDAERAYLYARHASPARSLGAPARRHRRRRARRASRTGESFVSLAGATITEEDPAEPACPSLGTVWRRFVPGETGQRADHASAAPPRPR